jgi:hypothetical protein
MSTRPLGPPQILTDDPGPWSVISSTFAWQGGPGRRRALPPMGLMISPAPEVGLPLAGLDTGSSVAGVGPVKVIGAAREPAFTLRFDGDVLHGISPYVLRTWPVPELLPATEERPGDDPAADLPPAIHPGALDAPELPGAVESPGGEYLGVYTREPRADVVAILRSSDRAIVRWIRGARAVAWSADGGRIAIGNQWGVILGEALPAEG